MGKHIRLDDLDAVGGGHCWGAHGKVSSLSFREALARRAQDQATNLLGVCAKWDGAGVGLFRPVSRRLASGVARLQTNHSTTMRFMSLSRQYYASILCDE